MKKALLSTIFLTSLIFGIRAQSIVTGRVTSAEDSEPLVGVTVREKGTSNGAVTDVDGNYRITLTRSDAVLVIQYLGFSTREIPVGNRSTIDVTLESDVTSLDEVVITAYGIERQADAVGYATASLKSEEFAEAKQINVAQSLAGKVAGVNITAPATGPAGSTNILIRGMRSFNSDNRPLIVVDGVILSNDIFDPASKWGGRDTGDGLTSLNPDDIASIDILKGAAASALYGALGQGGVLLVTTKKGVSRKGIGVEVTSNFMIEEIAVFPEFQDQYGQGTQGSVPAMASDATTLDSWGERLDGRNVINFDGVERPYTAIDRKENLKKYYETGSTFTNTLALTGGNENANARFSISNLDHQGVVPETTYGRLSLNLLTTAKLGEKVTAEMKANYVREDALNRPNLSDNPSNPAKSLNLIPANIDIDLYRRNVRDESGNAVQVFNTPFTLNPYWGPQENINTDSRDRFIGYIKLGYQFTDWLKVQGRLSLDYFTQRLNNLEELGTAHNVSGEVWNDSRNSKTQSHDLLLLGSTDLSDDFSLSYTVGGTTFRRSVEFFRSNGRELVLRDKPNVNNALDRRPGEYRLTEERINGIFGNVNVGFRNFLFLDGAVRKEWHSTLTNPNDLDGSNNALTYGSVSGSFVFTDAFDLPDVISYGKLRASIGTAGGGTRPYRTSLSYELEGQSFNGFGNGSIRRDNLFPNPNIEPNLTISKELGANVSFLEDRLSFDVTLYQTNTTNQILEQQVSRTSGFQRILINAGELENKGIELRVDGSPIRNADFSWDVSFNFARNRAEVISVSDGLEETNPDGDNTSRLADVSVLHRIRESPAALYGRKFLRDDQGRVVHGADGIPLTENENSLLGNFNPDFIGGITNTFTYKNFSFSFLIDAKLGGQVSSLTKMFALRHGLDQETLVGRDSDDFTLVGEGVNEAGEVNTTPVNLFTYWMSVSGVGEKTVLDASYIKMREIRFNYRLPQSLIGDVFNSVTVGVVGRNLFFFRNDLDKLGIDPEGLYNNTNSVGLEYQSLPSTRSYGFNINVSF